VEEEEKFMFEEPCDEFKFFPKRGDRAEIIKEHPSDGGETLRLSGGIIIKVFSNFHLNEL